MKIFIFFLLLIFSIEKISYGATPDCPSQFISSSEKGPFEIVPSGRESPEDLVLFEKVLNDFIKPGGLADRLNLTHPSHQMIFSTSELMGILAALGRNAVGHWIDGGELAMSRAAGVYEFFTSGCQTCRSYYTDTTHPIDQIFLIYHVLGHLHVAAHSVIRLVRGGDQMTASLQLEKLMRETVQSGVDADDVAQWYQHLSSLPMLQDFAFGGYESVESFLPTTSYDQNKRRIPLPRRPTLSVLQALVANLPASTPTWKIQVAKIFEQMNRYMGAVPPQKILNEGFATLMMDIIASHSEYVSSDHLIKYAQLLAGVLGHRGIILDSPYWLGLEAWRTERLRFNSQPSIRNLSVIMQDAAFIKHGTTMIETMDDREFLRTTLDERFVRKHKLLLFQKAVNIDSTLPNRGKDDNAQLIVTSTDPREIIDAIIDQFGDKRNWKPQIELTSIEAGGGQAITLRHINFKDFPMQLRSTVQTLFVIAKMMEKTVSLETQFFTDKKITPLRIEVKPHGNVKIFVKANGEEKFDEKLTKKSQAAIDWYRDDNAGMLNEQLTEAEDKKYTRLSIEIIDRSLQPAMGFISHAPTAAHALDEYAKMLKSRMARAFKMIREGKMILRSTKKGFAFSPLPIVPEFQFDQRAIRSLQKNSFKSNPFNGLTGGFLKHGLLSTTFLDIGTGDGGKGDRRWTKANENKAESADDGEKEEDDDDQSPSDIPSDGKENAEAKPFEVEITFEELAEILDLELPNSKPRDGEDSTAHDRSRDGGIRRYHGEILWSRMMGPIMVKGQMMLDARDKKLHGDNFKKQKYSSIELMNEGLKWVTPEDHVVVNHEPIPRPNSKAVLARIMDQSGSMHGIPQELIKKFYNTMIGMLKKKYAFLEVINIGFNESKALLMTDEQFFGGFLNGGDRYILGWKKGTEVLSDEKYRDYDKYGLLAGDFQSASGADIDEAMYEFKNQLNYGAAIQTIVSGDVATPELIGPVKKLAAEDPWFDYGVLGQTSSSQIELLMKFFGKNKPKKNH